MARNRNSTATAELDTPKENDMTDTDTLTETTPETETVAPRVEIADYVPETAPLLYADHVTALIDAGEGKAARVTVPTEVAAKHKRYFSKAANAAERTARVHGSHDNGDGTTTLVFTLAPRQSRPRKPKEETPVETSGENVENVENVESDTPENGSESATVDSGEVSGE